MYNIHNLLFSEYRYMYTCKKPEAYSGIIYFHHTSAKFCLLIIVIKGAWHNNSKPVLYLPLKIKKIMVYV